MLLTVSYSDSAYLITPVETLKAILYDYYVIFFLFTQPEVRVYEHQLQVASMNEQFFHRIYHGIVQLSSLSFLLLN